ncbi:MAG: MetS family NSS transporter small subunit [Desulfovibrio sp.]
MSTPAIIMMTLGCGIVLVGLVGCLFMAWKRSRR